MSINNIPHKLSYKIVAIDPKDARTLSEGDYIRIVKITPTAIWGEKDNNVHRNSLVNLGSSSSFNAHTCKVYFQNGSYKTLKLEETTNFKDLVNIMASKMNVGQFTKNFYVKETKDNGDIEMAPNAIVVDYIMANPNNRFVISMKQDAKQRISSALSKRISSPPGSKTSSRSDESEEDSELLDSLERILIQCSNDVEKEKDKPDHGKKEHKEPEHKQETREHRNTASEHDKKFFLFNREKSVPPPSPPVIILPAPPPRLQLPDDLDLLLGQLGDLDKRRDSIP